MSGPSSEVRENGSLIVGAGPVGLAAAVFLAARGRMPRVVERRAEPSTRSKALAVNPRTLEILEAIGLTPRLLELGRPIRGARFRRRGRVLATLPMAGIHPRYPFMLALSQARTEALLAEAFERAGGRVERGVELVGCRPSAEGVEADLQPAGGGRSETGRHRWLLAADGSRSTVREALGIAFDGDAFAEDWHLADAPLATALAPDHAHVVFQDDGSFLFLLPVVDGVEGGVEGVWRVMSSRPDPLSRLSEGEPTGPPVWSSSFRVAHRVARTLSLGHVHLAGDAAHVHSPVGARGMNLGVEDAHVFAELERADRLDLYHRRRADVDRRVVQRVRRMSTMVAADGALPSRLRATALPLAARIPFVRRRLVTTLTGLDHALGDGAG